VEAPEEVADYASSPCNRDKEQGVGAVKKIAEGPFERGALRSIREGEILYQRPQPM
jgi:hypothetical protein